MRKREHHILIFLFCVLGALNAQQIPSFKVEPIPAYNDLIYNESGWTGADGSFSAALSDSVILWLYSDTWIGDIASGKHENATIVNNSIAVQTGKNPATAKIRYYWGKDAEGRNAAFITPQDSLGYFWLFDGIVLQNTLYFIPIQITSSRGNGAFGFKLIGTWLVEVENPGESPKDWQMNQRKIPFGHFSRNGNEFLGSALLQVENFVYIYGCHEDWSKGISGRNLIVARVEADYFTDFEKWRFYTNGEWVEEFAQSEKLFNELGAEFSVSYQASIDRYVAVYTHNGLSDSIMVRFSETPAGPWSEARLVYVCPEKEWHPSYFCYSGKAHPELSREPNELIITYVCNSGDFWQLAKDARIYWPRFLRMTFNTE